MEGTLALQQVNVVLDLYLIEEKRDISLTYKSFGIGFVSNIQQVIEPSIFFFWSSIHFSVCSSKRCTKPFAYILRKPHLSLITVHDQYSFFLLYP